MEGGQRAHNAQKKVYSLPVSWRVLGWLWRTVGLRHQEDGASWCGESPLCGGSCGLPLPWVWGLLTAVLVFFLVPVWSLLHRGNLGKHADQILHLSKDHSQDKELVLLQLDAAAGSILPPACLQGPPPALAALPLPLSGSSQQPPPWPPCRLLTVRSHLNVTPRPHWPN